MKAEASGFLLKVASRDQLASAIRTVAGGDQFLAPAITRRLIEDFCAKSDLDQPATDSGKLSDRELDTLCRS